MYRKHQNIANDAAMILEYTLTFFRWSVMQKYPSLWPGSAALIYSWLLDRECLNRTNFLVYLRRVLQNVVGLQNLAWFG